MKRMNSMRAWTIWALAAFFYLYELALRISPSVMVSDLMQDLNITAKYIGLLGGVYYLAYTPLQLPVGLLIDRFGARLLLTLATLACAIGSILFGLSPSIAPVLAARFLIGMGSAFAWVGVIYLISHWFPEKRMGLLIGLASSLGVLGGFIATGPSAILLQHFSWRVVLLNFGFIGLVTALLIWWIIRNDPKEIYSTIPKIKPNFQQVLSGFMSIVKNKQTWIAALYSTMIYSCTVVFAELWGVTFIQTAHGFSPIEAAFGISMIYLGWMAGGPIVGSISDHIERRKPLTIVGAFGTLATILSILYIPMNTTPYLLYGLLFLFGLFSCGQLLSFSLAIENNLEDVKASSLAMNNFVTMLGGMVISPLAGLLLDLNWDGSMNGNVRLYSVSDFHIALTALPIMAFLAIVISFFIKETYCKMVSTQNVHPFEPHSD